MDKQTFIEGLLKDARQIVKEANKELTFKIVNGATVSYLEQQLALAKDHLSKSASWELGDDTSIDFWGSEEDVNTERAFFTSFHEILGFDLLERTSEQGECDECCGYKSEDCGHCTSNSVLASSFHNNIHALNSATRYAIIEYLVYSLQKKA